MKKKTKKSVAQENRKNTLNYCLVGAKTKIFTKMTKICCRCVSSRNKYMANYNFAVLYSSSAATSSFHSKHQPSRKSI